MRPVAGIVFAASTSHEFGSPKPLAKFGKSSALEVILDISRVADLRPIIVVLGADAEAVGKESDFRNCEVVVNKAYEKGDTSTLQAGLRAIQRTCSGAALMRIDHPLVRSATVKNLLKAFCADTSRVVQPLYQGREGHPLILPLTFREELLALDGRAKFREVLFKENRGRDVFVTDEGVTLSFNTPEEYEGLLKRYLP